MSKSNPSHKPFVLALIFAAFALLSLGAAFALCCWKVEGAGGFLAIAFGFAVWATYTARGARFALRDAADFIRSLWGGGCPPASPEPPRLAADVPTNAKAARRSA